MVIFTPALTEEEEKQQVLQVEELLKHEKGTIHFVDHWGKRKLAYSVKRQRQGYYEWFYFETEPGRIAEIDRKLKMSESILRFMTLSMEKAQVKNLQNEIARRKDAGAAGVSAPSVAESVTQTEPVAAEEPETEGASEAQEPSPEA
jgi:small subunit ribosomal protein S6